MVIFPAKTLNPGDPNTFTGPVHAAHLAQSDLGTPVTVYRVAFDAGGRTNWHTHSGAQWLFVVEGRIKIQVEDGPAHVLEVGDAAVIAPGEKHWHGAAPGGHGVHLAVNVDLVTTWLDPVSDAAYGS